MTCGRVFAYGPRRTKETVVVGNYALKRSGERASLDRTDIADATMLLNPVQAENVEKTMRSGLPENKKLIYLNKVMKYSQSGRD